MPFACKRIPLNLVSSLQLSNLSKKIGELTLKVELENNFEEEKIKKLYIKPSLLIS